MSNNTISIIMTQTEFRELLPLVFEYKEASVDLIRQLARKQKRPKDTTNLDRWEQLDQRLGQILSAAIVQSGRGNL